MVLHVPFTSFLELARSWGVKEAFVSPSGESVIVSAAHPSQPRILKATVRKHAEEVNGDLRNAGLTPYPGQWEAESAENEGQESEEWPFVAAVSYIAAEEMPGVWVDAYKELPAQVTVLRRMYDDFRSTGELDEIPFEEFIRLSHPNVVILSPADLREFARQDEPDCPPPPMPTIPALAPPAESSDQATVELESIEPNPESPPKPDSKARR
jgi:hypothetical protein